MTGHLLLDPSSLQEFFRERVVHAISALRLNVSQDVEFYLVNLLATFAQTEKLYETTEKGEVQDKALALQLLESMLATPHQRVRVLKRLGDLTLYISGYFGDSLYRSMVNIDYYVKMGHTAYASLSQTLSDEGGYSLRELFGELAHNFVKFVDVLSEVALESQKTNDQNILKLYERWLLTGSSRVEAALSKEGIIPNPQIRSRYEH